MTYGYGFDGKAPEPCTGEAGALGVAVCNVVEACRALAEAKVAVPKYTAQWSDKDYYANELEDYYRACEALYTAMKGAK
jgi:hypothetical protein